MIRTFARTIQMPGEYSYEAEKYLEWIERDLEEHLQTRGYAILLRKRSGTRVTMKAVYVGESSLHDISYLLDLQERYHHEHPWFLFRI